MKNKIGQKVKILPIYDERGKKEKGNLATTTAGRIGILVNYEKDDLYPMKVKFETTTATFLFKEDEVEFI